MYDLTIPFFNSTPILINTAVMIPDTMTPSAMKYPVLDSGPVVAVSLASIIINTINMCVTNVIH